MDNSSTFLMEEFEKRGYHLIYDLTLLEALTGNFE